MARGFHGLIDMHDASGSQLDDEEEIQVSEEHIYNRQEVAGEDICRMRLQERRPSLTRRRIRSQPTQIFLDAAFSDVDPDFDQLCVGYLTLSVTYSTISQ